MALPVWQKLIALVDIDNLISSVEEQVKKSENQLKQDQDKLTHLQSSLALKKNELKEKQKNAAFIELKIQEIDSKEAEKKKALDKVEDQKSYEAIQKELSILSVERQDQEEILVSAWNEIELLTNKVKIEVVTIENQNKDFEEKVIASRQQKDVLIEKQKELLLKRAEREKEILPQWLTRYDKMRKQVPNPIVKLSNSCCSVCFYMVLPQDNAKILKGEIIPCRNCYRLLYFDTQESQEPVF